MELKNGLLSFPPTIRIWCGWSAAIPHSTSPSTTSGWTVVVVVCGSMKIVDGLVVLVLSVGKGLMTNESVPEGVLDRKVWVMDAKEVVGGEVELSPTGVVDSIPDGGRDETGTVIGGGVTWFVVSLWRQQEPNMNPSTHIPKCFPSDLRHSQTNMQVPRTVSTWHGFGAIL